jgi:ubiquinone/menaquinone biosynthesis C-methylase UbiE
MNNNNYYNKVADYYDVDAADFETRYWQNPVLQQIRQAFREEVKKNKFESVLEIGFGTGLDVCHFATIFPEKKVYGIDISPEMHHYAYNKIISQKLENLDIKVGTPEDLENLFPDIKFDHIYVFFGALNTVNDLKAISNVLANKINPNGTMTLTFVNKWYLVEVLIHLLKLNPKKAFRRFNKVWGGYSELKYLESKCYSPQEIKNAFDEDFNLINKKGYSICYPAWYRHNWVKKLGKRASSLLWKGDMFLNKTPLWSLGEYALYSFSKKRKIS